MFIQALLYLLRLVLTTTRKLRYISVGALFLVYLFVPTSTAISCFRFRESTRRIPTPSEYLVVRNLASPILSSFLATNLGVGLVPTVYGVRSI